MSLAGLLKKRFGLLVGEPQVVFVELDQLASRPQPRQRQVVHLARPHDDVSVAGKVAQ